MEKRTVNQPAADGNPVMNAFYADPPVAERVAELAYPGEILPKPVIKCSNCRSSIGDNMLRGKAARAKSAVIAISGHGFCIKCRSVTPVAMLIHSDGTVQVRKNGRWVTQRHYIAPTLARAKFRGGIFGGRIRDRIAPLLSMTRVYGANMRARLAPAVHDFFDFGKSPVYRAMKARF